MAERELEAVLDDEQTTAIPDGKVLVEGDYMANLERTVQAQQFTIEALQQRMFALNVDVVNLTAEALSKVAKQPS